MERLVLPVLNGNGQMSTVPAHVTVSYGMVRLLLWRIVSFSQSTEARP